MNIDSALKYLWLAVGILILGCILTGIFFALDLDDSFRRPYVEQGVTVDNSSKEKLERVNLELRYGTPVNLGNSENYMLKVYITYKDDETKLKAGFDSYTSDEDVDEPSNVIFLNKELKPIQTLLSQRALIVNTEYPMEPLEEDENGYSSTKEMKFILYEIVFSDTDGDGQLDTGDQSDLYMSDLNGGNFISVTKNLNIQNVDFLDNYETILIQYSIKEVVHFARYSVINKQLIEMPELDSALLSVKEILTK